MSQDKDGYAALNRKDQEAQKPVEPGGAAGTVASKKYAGPAAIFRKLLFDSPLNVLLLAVPFGIAAPKLHWSDQANFSLNFLAILPMAKILGSITEELADSVGETLGGLLNASFGNAVEMLLSAFALRKGLVTVVQGSLLGSVLSNLLLVLGMCFFFGGLKFHKQKYNADGARVQSNLLLLSVLAMVIPSLVGLVTDEEGVSLAMSRGAAIILAVLYGLYLIFQLGTHKDYFETQAEEGVESEEEPIHPGVASMMLAVVTFTVAICSEGLVDSVEGITQNMGISEHFIGVILLPIVGNAAEHLTAVDVALKNKMDLSLGVALGSSSQIALLVVPFSVCAGWAIGVPMDLNFRPLGTGILLVTVLIVGSVTSDRESNWLEGAMLIAAYVMVGLTFWTM